MFIIQSSDGDNVLCASFEWKSELPVGHKKKKKFKGIERKWKRKKKQKKDEDDEDDDEIRREEKKERERERESGREEGEMMRRE